MKGPDARADFSRVRGMPALFRAALLGMAMLGTAQAGPSNKVDEADPSPRVPAAIPENSKVEVFRFTPSTPEYQQIRPTEVSRMMRQIERKVNAESPRFPIAILDDDSINLRYTYNDPTFRTRLEEVLRDRNIQLRWNLKSDVLQALGGLKGPEGRYPVAIRVTPDMYAASANPLDVGITQSFMCLVIPPVADVSSQKHLENWLGQAGPTYMQARHDPGPHALMLRATWHEIWHCLDTEFFREQYVVRGDKAIDNVLRMHKAEVFADVAATLTMATMGYSEIARDMADIRALSSYWNGRNSVKGARPTDESYYEGATYFISRAQELMHKHIQNVGTAQLSAYSMMDIARIAAEITESAALNKEEILLLTDFYARGDVYLSSLRGEAEGGNRESVKRHEFLSGVKAKAMAAKERLLVDQGKIVERQRSNDSASHRDATDILKEISPEEKRAIETLVHVRAAGARLRGETPEQGVVELIDDWRRDVHTGGGHQQRDRQLYILSLMLAYGELEAALGRKPLGATSDLGVPVPPLKMQRLDFGPQS